MTTTTTFRNTTTRRRADGTLAPVRPHEVTVKRATPITPAPKTITPMVDPALDPMSGRPTGDLSADEWARYADQWHARADKADAAGPVLDESYTGCALVTLASALPEGAEQGLPCLVKLNRLGPMRAELRWVKPLDDEVCKIGLHYLDAR